MKKFFLLAWSFSLSILLFAQEENPPFWDDVQNFKKKEAVSMPVPNQILLIGSSSFTKWQDVNDYFPGYKILNRAFGGSSLPDLIRFVDDIVFPYKPKQIVIYCGDNDLAASDTVSAELVAARFKTLFSLIRKKMPKVPIAYVSIKPSPSRQLLSPKMLVANVYIKQWLETKKRTAFIDVYHQMIDDEGKPIQEIFLEDNLHMNKKGYAIWQKVMQPYLLK